MSWITVMLLISASVIHACTHTYMYTRTLTYTHSHTFDVTYLVIEITSKKLDFSCLNIRFKSDTDYDINYIWI